MSKDFESKVIKTELTTPRAKSINTAAGSIKNDREYISNFGYHKLYNPSRFGLNNKMIKMKENKITILTSKFSFKNYYKKNQTNTTQISPQETCKRISLKNNSFKGSFINSLTKNNFQMPSIHSIDYSNNTKSKRKRKTTIGSPTNQKISRLNTPKYVAIYYNKINSLYKISQKDQKKINESYIKRVI